jgi:hypothetical protein
LPEFQPEFVDFVFQFAGDHKVFWFLWKLESLK